MRKGAVNTCRNGLWIMEEMQNKKYQIVLYHKQDCHHKLIYLRGSHN